MRGGKRRILLVASRHVFALCAQFFSDVYLATVFKFKFKPKSTLRFKANSTHLAAPPPLAHDHTHFDIDGVVLCEQDSRPAWRDMRFRKGSGLSL